MFRKARRLHMIGIGGVGMSGIAEVLVNLGYPVSGSDLASNPATRRLKKLGARIHRGHSAEHVRDADVVVVSSAVRPENPEIVEARRRHIPVIPRAEMLAELMRMKYGIAVAGAHGKTTTTALIAEVLSRGRLDPTVVIGGRVGKLRSGAKLGRGEMMVAEADESDGSFLKMKPTIAVVTNIDREHLDYYRDVEQIRDAFLQFLSRVPFYGAAVVCIDDPHVRAILPKIDRNVITYGVDDDADVRAVNIRTTRFTSSFALEFHGRKLGRITLSLPGRHSVSNSLAAVAVGLELDVAFKTIAAALKSFRGVDRRLQLRGEIDGALVVDDYGHHPTEIRATLEAIRDGFNARTFVVFQPHRFSRTRALLDEFAGAFDLAAGVIVTDIYPGGEQRVPGLDGSAIVDAVRRHGHADVRYEPDTTTIPELVRRWVQPGDIVLTLGAGDIWKVSEAIVRAGRTGTGGSRKRSAVR